MKTRIDWVLANTRLLNAIAGEFRETRPFDGLTIGTGIHLEPKTVALLLTLTAGGAQVVATGNLNSTQQGTNDYLAEHGVRVIGAHTTDREEHRGFLRQVVAAKPELLLDNGGDLFAAFLDEPYQGLIGGTEETTSGRMRLAPLREELARPILVINDSPIKQFAENRLGVGQSVFESMMRLTNLGTNGRRVTVFGYGSCGQGVARNFKNANATVTVVEADPVRRLEALLDGFVVTSREEALATADFIVTVTGASGVLNPADLTHLKNDVLLGNAGHFPDEIDVDGILASPEVVGIDATSPASSGCSSRMAGR
ncbi:adenosylhomocysteinase [Microterricola viridarii]|uniref:adenosylhomocysteinase n=1 Tax=Microterricola viridarii TaxID=412690 RepID=UPI000B1335A1|nr:adenosylhomocysteinase [Microterricola viridarii]